MFVRSLKGITAICGGFRKRRYSNASYIFNSAKIWNEERRTDGAALGDIDLTEKYFDINSTRGDYGENKPKTKPAYVKFILTTRYSL